MRMIEDRFLRKILLFVVLTALLGLAVGHLVIAPDFTKLLLANTENNAVQFTQHIKAMLLKGHPPGKKIISEDESEHVEDIWKMVHMSNISRLKLFDPTGKIVFSTEASEIGEMNTKAYFRDIVARGDIFTKIARKNSRSAEGDVVSMDMAEIYVPLMHNGSFGGALEVYYDISEELQGIQGVVFRANLMVQSGPIVFGYAGPS